MFSFKKLLLNKEATKTDIFPVLLVNFIGILGYSIVVPILIFIVTDFGGNGFIYGILGAMYPLFQFLGAPVLGRFSDRIGRKKVLIISQAGTFLAWTLFLLAFALPEFEIWSQDSSIAGQYTMTLPLLIIFLARILDGFTGGNISVANAYLSDISTEQNRKANFGKMAASTNLGFVLGPAFAGLLASTYFEEVLPLLIAALISLIAIFVIKVKLKESVPGIVDSVDISLKGIRRFFQVEHKDCYIEGTPESNPKNLASWKFVAGISGIPLLFSIYFITFFSFSLFYAGLPIYANTILEWSAIDLGIFFAYFSLIMVIVEGPVLSSLSKKVTDSVLVLFGSLLLGISFVGLSFNHTALLYIAITILSIGNGLMWPSFLSMLSGTGPKSLQGAIQGYGASMGSAASMLGLITGGILFEIIGTYVFVFGGFIFFIISILILIHFYKNQRDGRWSKDALSDDILKGNDVIKINEL